MTDAILSYYEQHAQHYFERTRSLDMAEVRQAFLSQLPINGRILDIGCGSGRDSVAFKAAGFDVEAFDGSSALANLAAANTGLTVRHLTYEQMDWHESFDGLWACSSLVHLDDNVLAATLRRIHKAGKPGATFFTCFKYGRESYTQADGRSYNAFVPQRAVKTFDEAGFEVFNVWLTRHVADPETVWVNILARKPAA